ncbi:MAG: DNA repair protein RadC [Eubacteriales bacterium]
MHEGHRERLRTRFEKEGLLHFQDHEVLELMLFYAIPRKDTNPIAHRLLREFGSLSAVFEANISDLSKVEGVGQNTAVYIKLLVDVMKKYRTEKLKKGPRIITMKDAGEYACELLFAEKHEQVWLLCLNMKSEVIAAEKICDGTLKESPVYPRKIVAVALKHNAAKIILIHNHPGGVVKPSPEDIKATRTIIGTVRTLDMDMLDHIITSDNQFFSFAAKQFIENDMDKESAYTCQYEDGFLDEDAGHTITFKQGRKKTD